MSPGEKGIVEALEEKISKLGFHTKLRMIYVGHKDIFSKARGVAPIMGALQQFSSLDLNGFRVAKSTKVDEGIIFKLDKKYKLQNKIMKHYAARSLGEGATPFILNTEELATIYHFPGSNIKNPWVQRKDKKTTFPPSILPTSEGSKLNYIEGERTLADEVEARRSKIKNKNKTINEISSAPIKPLASVSETKDPEILENRGHHAVSSEEGHQMESAKKDLQKVSLEEKDLGVVLPNDSPVISLPLSAPPKANDVPVVRRAPPPPNLPV
jgi:hypothetical protein